MGHGGVLVESGRARRSSADPRLHGGGSCSGTSDSRSNRGAARSHARGVAIQRSPSGAWRGNQRQRSSLIGRRREVHG